MIGSVTQTFAIPYRPSADFINCTGGRWFDGSGCFNGKAVNLTFNRCERDPIAKFRDAVGFEPPTQHVAGQRRFAVVVDRLAQRLTGAEREQHDG